jgi:hypothetical protein
VIDACLRSTIAEIIRVGAMINVNGGARWAVSSGECTTPAKRSVDQVVMGFCFDLFCDSERKRAFSKVTAAAMISLNGNAMYVVFCFASRSNVLIEIRVSLVILQSGGRWRVQFRLLEVPGSWLIDVDG